MEGLKSISLGEGLIIAGVLAVYGIFYGVVQRRTDDAIRRLDRIGVSMDNDIERLDRMISQYDEMLEEYAEMRGRYIQMTNRCDRMIEQYDGILGRYDGILGRYDRILGRYDRILGRYDNLDKRYDNIAAANASYLQFVDRYCAMVEANRVELERIEREAAPLLLTTAQVDRLVAMVREGQQRAIGLLRQFFSVQRANKEVNWPQNAIDDLLKNRLTDAQREELCCTITSEVMQHPVQAPDRKYYDRWALQKIYDAGTRRCPCDPSRALPNPSELVVDAAKQAQITALYSAAEAENAASRAAIVAAEPSPPRPQLASFSRMFQAVVVPQILEENQVIEDLQHEDAVVDRLSNV